MKPRRKVAKKKAARKPTRRAITKAVRPPTPASLTRPRIAVVPAAFLEMIRSRGLVFTFHDADRCVAVQFYDRGGLNHPTVSRSAGQHVCFQNLGEVDRTLTLSTWPFEGDAREILVPAGATVGQFRLDPDGSFSGTVTVTVDPPFEGGAPGDPGFDASG